MGGKPAAFGLKLLRQNTPPAAKPTFSLHIASLIALWSEDLYQLSQGQRLTTMASSTQHLELVTYQLNVEAYCTAPAQQVRTGVELRPPAARGASGGAGQFSPAAG